MDIAWLQGLSAAGWAQIMPKSGRLLCFLAGMLFSFAHSTRGSGLFSQAPGNVQPASSQLLYYPLADAIFFQKLPFTILREIYQFLAPIDMNLPFSRIADEYTIFNAICCLVQIYTPPAYCASATIEQIVLVHEMLMDYIQIHRQFPQAFGTLLNGNRSLSGLCFCLAFGRSQHPAEWANLIRNIDNQQTRTAAAAAVVDRLMLEPKQSALTSMQMLQSIVKSSSEFGIISKAALAASPGLHPYLGVLLLHYAVEPHADLAGILASFNPNFMLAFIEFPKSGCIVGDDKCIKICQRNHTLFRAIGSDSVKRWFSIINLIKFRAPSALLAINPSNLNDMFQYEVLEHKYALVALLWDREDAAEQLAMLSETYEWTEPLCLLALNPARFFNQFGMGLLSSMEFVLFIAKCTVLRETASRRETEARIFALADEFVDRSPHTLSRLDLILLVSLMQLAWARSKQGLLVRLAGFAFSSRHQCKHRIANRIPLGSSLWDSYFALIYLEHFGFEGSKLLARIISSAIVRNDARLLNALRGRIDHKFLGPLLEHADFPLRDIYLLIFFTLFSTRCPPAAFHEPGTRRCLAEHVFFEEVCAVVQPRHVLRFFCKSWEGVLLDGLWTLHVWLQTRIQCGRLPVLCLFVQAVLLRTHTLDAKWLAEAEYDSDAVNLKGAKWTDINLLHRVGIFVCSIIERGPAASIQDLVGRFDPACEDVIFRYGYPLDDHQLYQYFALFPVETEHSAVFCVPARAQARSAHWPSMLRRLGFTSHGSLLALLRIQRPSSEGAQARHAFIQARLFEALSTLQTFRLCTVLPRALALGLAVLAVLRYHEVALLWAGLRALCVAVGLGAAAVLLSSLHAVFQLAAYLHLFHGS